MDQIAAAIEGELPAWASVFATLLLAVAATIARRISRRSARPQGERLGTLEQAFALEQTRRRQVEDELWRQGIDLPLWPPDGRPPGQPGKPEEKKPAPATTQLAPDYAAGYYGQLRQNADRREDEVS